MLTDAAFTAHRFEAGETYEHRRIRSFMLLEASTRLERELAITSGVVCRTEQGKEVFAPVVPTCSIDWLNVKGQVVDDGSAEFRIARALGSIRPFCAKGESIQGLRENLLPLIRKNGHWGWHRKSTRFVWQRNASLLDNLASVLRRRLVDAQSVPKDGLPLDCHPHLAARFDDILALWENRCDEPRIISLTHAFACINTKDFPREVTRTASHADSHGISGGEAPPASADNASSRLPRAYALLKLCFMGGRLPPRPGARVSEETPYAPGNLRMLTHLWCGDITSALKLAADRLHFVNYPPILRRFDAPMEYHLTPNDCRKLAGLLLIPVQNPFQLVQLTIRKEPKI
ncbi:MAG: hypothetical protein SNJ84_03315 [Verrucomicrobiia bacterium]